MKTLILAGLLLAFSFFQPAAPPCAIVAVSLAQAQVPQGGTQVVTSDVTNCGDRKTKFQVTVTVTDAVGHILLLRNDAHMLNVNETVSLQDQYAVAANAPLGTYRVMTIAFVTVNGNTTEVARDQQTFEVIT